jgi:hypothetical protein
VKQRVLTVLWPAFAMAGVLEMLVFSQVDPAELHGLGASGAGWSPQAIYTLAFLAFWAVISVASAVTLWLVWPGLDVDADARL